MSYTLERLDGVGVAVMSKRLSMHIEFLSGDQRHQLQHVPLECDCVGQASNFQFSIELIFPPTDLTWSIQHVQYSAKLEISSAASSGKKCSCTQKSYYKWHTKSKA